METSMQTNSITWRQSASVIVLGVACVLPAAAQTVQTQQPGDSPTTGATIMQHQSSPSMSGDQSGASASSGSSAQGGMVQSESSPSASSGTGAQSGMLQSEPAPSASSGSAAETGMPQNQSASAGSSLPGAPAQTPGSMSASTGSSGFDTGTTTTRVDDDGNMGWLGLLGLIGLFGLGGRKRSRDVVYRERGVVVERPVVR
jgi:hypothetical protein